MSPRRFGWLAFSAAAISIVAYEVSCVDTTSAVDPCPKYCTDIQATCTDVDQQYPDQDTCLRICGAINGVAPEAGAAANTIACRELNISSAKDEPDPNAKHQECVGAGVSAINCGGTQCADFCATDLALCTGSNAAYDSGAACESACAQWGASFDGKLIGSTGDTLQCRTYHLELSQSGVAADLITHCPHTEPISARCNSGGSDAGTDAGADSGSDDAGSDATGD